MEKSPKTLPSLEVSQCSFSSFLPSAARKPWQGASPAWAGFPRSTRGWRLVFRGDGKAGSHTWRRISEQSEYAENEGFRARRSPAGQGLGPGGEVRWEGAGQSGGGCVGQGARVERMYNESWPEEGASASSAFPCPPGQPLLCPVAWPWPGPLGGAPTGGGASAPAACRGTGLAGKGMLGVRGGAGKAGAEWDATLKGAFEGKRITQNGSSLSRLLSALFSVGNAQHRSFLPENHPDTNNIFLYLMPEETLWFTPEE